MAKPRIIKATHREVLAYRKTNPVNDLFGFIRHNGNKFPVEGLFEGPGEPNYEVMCLPGFHFSEGTHTLLATTQAEAIERVQENSIEHCTERCG
jgi:hypothetical protein